MFWFYLHSAAQYPEQVNNNIAVKYSVILRFKTVKYLSSKRNYCLKFAVSAKLTGAESWVSLNYIDFTFFRIFAPAVNKFFNAVSYVKIAA